MARLQHGVLPKTLLARSRVGAVIVSACVACVSEPAGTTTSTSGGGGASSFIDVGAGAGLVCEVGHAGGAGGKEEVAPCDPSAPHVSFQVGVAPLLVGCASELCHGSMEHADLVNRPSAECAGRLLVHPGEPADSYLLDKLAGQRLCCGAQMPLGGAPLATGELLAVHDWICEGAPND